MHVRAKAERKLRQKLKEENNMTVPYILDSKLENGVVTKEDLEFIMDDANNVAESAGRKISRISIFTEKDEEGNEYLAYRAFYSSHIRRTRRITGYFANVDNFNPGKAAELADRRAYKV